MTTRTRNQELFVVVLFSILTFGTLGQLLVAMLLPYFPMFKYTIVSFTVAFIATFPIDVLVWEYRGAIAWKISMLFARYESWLDRIDARGPSRRDWLIVIASCGGALSLLIIVSATQGKLLVMTILVMILMVSLVVIGVIKHRSKRPGE